MTAEPTDARAIDRGRYGPSAAREPVMTNPFEIRLPITDITP